METTTFRAILAAMLLAAASLGAQSAQTTQDLPWAVAEFEGGGDAAVRLPQMLLRGWGSVSTHVVNAVESEALRRNAAEAAKADIDQKIAKLKLDLDLKALDTLPSTEPAATLKAIADLEAKRGAVLAVPPDKLVLRAVWTAGKDGQPWAFAPRKTLLDQTKAKFLFTGTLRTIGDYFKVGIELYSALENRVLSRWEGQFAPEEAPVFMAQAADQFRTFLLGREWAGLSVTGFSGTRVRVDDVWHVVPWFSDDLTPGPVEMAVEIPGGHREIRTLVLESGKRAQASFQPGDDSHVVVLETVPPGASLYLDSRYLGASPQTVESPLVTSRVRAQSPGFATTAWEIGPETLSPSVKVLLPPQTPRSVPDAKDRFYLSLAAFSFSLTSTAFLGAWRDEQVKLTNAYATAGAAAGYYEAYNRYQIGAISYGAGIALTSAVFVWMMFELGDYLGAAQDSLP